MIVLDTAALILWLRDESRLSIAAQEAISGEMRQGEIAISTISVLDIAKYIEDGRLELSVSARSWLSTLATIEGLRVIPVDLAIAVRAATMSPSLTSHQRLILATARVLGGALITPDARLREHTHGDSIW